MKKLVLIGVLGSISALSNAEQPLVIQQSSPAQMYSNPTPVISPQYYSQSQPVRYNSPANPNYSVSAEYTSYEADLEWGDTVKLDGFALGVSSSPHISGWYGKFEYMQDDSLDADYYEFAFGGQLNLFSYNGLYALASAGLGFAVADSPELYNTVNFVTLPVGFEVGYSVIPELSLYGGVGYKWLWDTTSSTTCRDGSTSNSTGSGTCSWHGGIAYYNDYVGDNDGVTYKAGLRYNF